MAGNAKFVFQMPFAQTNHINKKIYLLEQDECHPIFIPALPFDGLLPLLLSLSVWFITESKWLSPKFGTWIRWGQTFWKKSFAALRDPTEKHLYCIILFMWGRFLTEEVWLINKWVHGSWDVGAALGALRTSPLYLRILRLHKTDQVATFSLHQADSVHTGTWLYTNMIISAIWHYEQYSQYLLVPFTAGKLHPGECALWDGGNEENCGSHPDSCHAWDGN